MIFCSFSYSAVRHCCPILKLCMIILCLCVYLLSVIVEIISIAFMILLHCHDIVLPLSWPYRPYFMHRTVFIACKTWLNKSGLREQLNSRQDRKKCSGSGASVSHGLWWLLSTIVIGILLSIDIVILLSIVLLISESWVLEPIESSISVETYTCLICTWTCRMGYMIECIRLLNKLIY
jgi:hypothetical protein